ncbi:MarR family winged helix-turn-helix transcriptional regulator [Streptomyces boninensis]|uniref:MarR family winged helix-turn-helix transcriptional regulator n=1 Tax=Streptomyces boninensis TaxID=2039455 RepID=UPI003B225D6A
MSAARDAGPADADLLSGAALTAFRLNGQFLAVADRLAEPAGISAAWWQVLGAVLPEPLPVAGIARTMGITRQSVQRIADLLVSHRLAAYEPNPAHRRAKLLAPTPEGRAAIAEIVPGHKAFAARLAKELGGTEEFSRVLDALRELSAALDAIEGRRD